MALIKSHLFSVLINIECWESIDSITITESSVSIVPSSAVNMTNQNIVIVCNNRVSDIIFARVVPL